MAGSGRRLREGLQRLRQTGVQIVPLDGNCRADHAPSDGVGKAAASSSVAARCYAEVPCT